jgi:biopolymer transport protein ExbB/TolQ
MTKPSQSLIWMSGFLIAVAALAALVAGRMVQNFQANPFFNGVILAVLVSGIFWNMRQVLRLARDVEWIETFKRSPPDRPLAVQPKLLAPMARMLGTRDRKQFALSTPSLRSILDSVYLRLEESRDLSRYLVGLAIFLGLLGTFWGLLVTIRSVAEIIGSLGVGSDPAAMFNALKENLKQPLSGMSTSFSTSLFGLASSLVLGFLDLQAGHAQNRFYNELEEWLSGMTRLSSGGLHVENEGANVPAYVQALLEQTADGLERMQRALTESERERHRSSEQLGELNTQLGRLADLLGRESREIRGMAETQEELKNVLKTLASAPNGARLSEDLRGELRLLSRTIAAAVDGKRAGSSQ